MNKYLKYLILALIQGLTEILPISSSGHLILFSNILDLPTNDLSLSIFLHLSSSLAVIIFFRKRIFTLLKGTLLYIFCKKERKIYKEEFLLFINIIIATIPAGIAGLILKDYIEKYLISPFSLGCLFITTAFLLLLTTTLKRNEVELINLKPRSALSIGIFQMIGILPGISRSGITYVGTKVNHLNSKDSSLFIFLLFLPVSLGSGLTESIKLINNPLSIDILPLLISLPIGFIVTLISLKLFLTIIKKEKMHIFSYYLIPLGIMLMIKGLYIKSF